MHHAAVGFRRGAQLGAAHHGGVLLFQRQVWYSK